MNKRKQPPPSHMVLFRRYFLAGLVVTTPLVLTGWIVAWLVNLVDGRTRHFLKSFLIRLGLDYHITLFDHNISVIPFGFGLLVVIVVISFIGMLATNYFGRKILDRMERVIQSVPGVRWIYTAATQISSALLNRNKNIFTDVVLIEYPRKGCYSLAFVTNKGIVGLTEEKQPLYSVFLPTTPNPTSGFFLLLPETDFHPCPLSVEEAMKLIISGGVILPPEYQGESSIPGGKLENLELTE